MGYKCNNIFILKGDNFMFKEKLKSLLCNKETIELILFDEELNLYAMTLCKDCQCDVIKKLGIKGHDIKTLKAIVNSLGYDLVSLEEYYKNGIFDEYGNKMVCCCKDSSYKVIKVSFNENNKEDYYMAWSSL